MLRSVRWLVAAAWLGALGFDSAPARAQATAPSPPRTEAELATARRLFADALRDEQERRFDAALEGFRRARDVRDAPPVEYRIGTCLEGLGRLAEALAAYDAAVRLGEGDAASAEVLRASRARSDALSKRVAHLTLTLSPRAPSDAETRVDGKPWRGGDVVLDPGSHHVEATASGATPFTSDLSLPEGGRVSLTVSLDPPAAATPATPPGADVHPDDAERGSTATTWGWVGIGAGTALLAGSIVSFALRESDIRASNRACPDGACVGAIDGGALAATNRARVEGPLGFALGAAGLAAVGVGIFLVIGASKHAPTVALSPTAGPTGGGFELRGAL